MSAASDEEEKAADSDTMVCCACCGKAEVDDVKLKKCGGCNLVKYCSVECQKNHRPQHKKTCQKRMTEIRDDNLFTQPDGSCHGECPICCLPLPLDMRKWGINSCCCKYICNGCAYANQKREIEQGMEQRCPYCRELLPNANEEHEKNYMKRVKVNDPVAICQVGKTRYREGDYEEAFEYFKKASELGGMEAHYNLSFLYRNGEGVEKDLKRQLYHLEEAAIGGYPDARYNLGSYEDRNGRINRAMKHFIIAANLGDTGALETVKSGFAQGIVSKEDYEAALRGHQAAVDATKSTQRDAANEYYKLQNKEY